MIKTLIFDFGDVFLNIDEKIRDERFEEMGFKNYRKQAEKLNHEYEKGKMTSDDFVKEHQKTLPGISAGEIKNTWNSMLLDLPNHRLQFLKHLATAKNYKLILLSNTNKIHIDWVESNVPLFYDFKNCFDHFYLSYEMGLRKPDPQIFEAILNAHELEAKECIFIDDKEKNTKAAAKVGLNTWNLKPGKEDVTQLFEIKKSLF